MRAPDPLTTAGLPIRPLARLKDVLGEFRKLEPGMPSGYIDMFLAVSLNPGLGPSDYAPMVGTIQPVASRILMEIGDYPRTRSDALRLVVSRPHPESRRQVQYHLSPKGYALALRAGWLLMGREAPSR